eukprot:1329134-Prorocentrum_lima.AAC.1
MGGVLCPCTSLNEHCQLAEASAPVQHCELSQTSASNAIYNLMHLSCSVLAASICSGRLPHTFHQ